MAEFGATATLTVELDDRSLRDARNEIEDELGAEVSVGTGRGAAAMADGGSRGASLNGGDVVSLAEDRNDTLEDILDELESGAGGGGGGGGTGLVPGVGGKTSTKGVLSRVAPFLAAAGLTFGGSEIAERGNPGVENNRQGLGITTPLFPALALGTSVFDAFTGGDPTPFSGDQSTSGPGGGPTSAPDGEAPGGGVGMFEFEGSDRELIRALVNQGKIEADSKLAALARNENRQFTLAPETEQRLEELLAREDSGGGGDSGSGSGLLASAGGGRGPRFDDSGGSEYVSRSDTGNNASPEAGNVGAGALSIAVNPNVSVEGVTEQDVERKVEEAMEQTKQDAVEEARRKLTRR